MGFFLLCFKYGKLSCYDGSPSHVRFYKGPVGGYTLALAELLDLGKHKRCVVFAGNVGCFSLFQSFGDDYIHFILRYSEIGRNGVGEEETR